LIISILLHNNTFLDTLSENRMASSEKVFKMVVLIIFSLALFFTNMAIDFKEYCNKNGYY